jgi:hypothetical protein
VRISGRVANTYATLRISLVVHSGDASVRNEFPGLHCFYVHAFLQTRCMPTTVFSYSLFTASGTGPRRRPRMIWIFSECDYFVAFPRNLIRPFSVRWSVPKNVRNVGEFTSLSTTVGFCRFKTLSTPMRAAQRYP